LDFLLRYFQKNGKFSFHLTFDDGLSEVYHTVMPILIEKGVPATVFVNSQFVDNRDLFYRYKAALLVDKINRTQQGNQELIDKILKINYLEKDFLDETAQILEVDFDEFLHTQQPYLSSEQLREMQRNGFTIGAHSIDHPNFALLTEDEQVRQTLQSCEYVQKNFGEQKAYFAFPFSSAGVKDTFFQKISSKVELTFGISAIGTSHNGKHIERIDMENYGKNAALCVGRAYLTRFLKRWI
jgi:peptidoglycan/xylan/chitin deacetylase (PgdA/CDA1 family)